MRARLQYTPHHTYFDTSLDPHPITALAPLEGLQHTIAHTLDTLFHPSRARPFIPSQYYTRATGRLVIITTCRCMDSLALRGERSHSQSSKSRIFGRHAAKVEVNINVASCL